MNCPNCHIGDIELYLIDIGGDLGFYCNDCEYSSKISNQENNSILDRIKSIEDGIRTIVGILEKNGIS